MDVNSKGARNIFLQGLLYSLLRNVCVSILYLYFISVLFFPFAIFQLVLCHIWTTRVIGLLLNCMVSRRFISHRLFSIRWREYLIVLPTVEYHLNETKIHQQHKTSKKMEEKKKEKNIPKSNISHSNVYMSFQRLNLFMIKMSFRR